MVVLVSEQGFAATTVTSVCARAKVSRRAFHEVFDDLESCLLAVTDQACRRASALISQAFEQAERWRDGVRSALAGLLQVLDAEPELARVLMVETLAAGSWALEHRERHVATLTRQVSAHSRAPGDIGSHPLAAEGVALSVLGIIQMEVLHRRPAPLIARLGDLMGIVVAPYLGADAVAAEMQQAEALAGEILAGRRRAPAWGPAAPLALPEMLRDPRAHRARRCLLYLHQHPESSNRQVADAVGIHSHTQISTLLARLARAGLLHKHGGRPGYANAWSVTAYGQQILNTHTSHISDTEHEFTVTS